MADHHDSPHPAHRHQRVHPDEPRNQNRRDETVRPYARDHPFGVHAHSSDAGHPFLPVEKTGHPRHRDVAVRAVAEWGDPRD